MKSVYLINPNRVREDVNELIWFMEKDDIANANIRANYIIEEVDALIAIINNYRREVK